MSKRNHFKITETDHLPRLELINSLNLIRSEMQAWELSIIKWEYLLGLCDQGRLIADGGVQSCCLCTKYYYGRSDECEDCPIKKAGFPGCSNTPYKKYCAAVENGNVELAKQAAEDEIGFLRRIQNGT